jgi:fucose permease
MNTPYHNKLRQIGLFISLMFIQVVLISSEVLAQSQNSDITDRAIDGGIGLGSIIAVVASWSRNKSIIMAILAGLMGWVYVVYFAFTREE